MVKGQHLFIGAEAQTHHFKNLDAQAQMHYLVRGRCSKNNDETRKIINQFKMYSFIQNAPFQELMKRCVLGRCASVVPIEGFHKEFFSIN